MKIRNILVWVTLGVGVMFFTGVGIVAAQNDVSIGMFLAWGRDMIAEKNSRYTVAERVSEIVSKKPHLKRLSASAGGKLRIFVFKQERKLEVNAPGWQRALVYPMTNFSGKLGPKLKEGDGQIPEGVYGIEYLNPNSRFHLSLKVSYPNEADRRRAKMDGRTDLGGDIMIHGKNLTIGCVPIGDEAIEDLFYLVDAVGIKNVSVVMAPYDMRNGRISELEDSSVSWYDELCREIEDALCERIF